MTAAHNLTGWAWHLGQLGWLSLPFDLARDQYARAIHAGWLRPSLLASAEWERALGRLESVSLGPWARRV
jgi:hypothetical protein